MVRRAEAVVAKTCPSCPSSAQAAQRMTEIAPGELSGETSSSNLIIESGGGMTLWSTPGTASKAESTVRLQLQPGQWVIIGRQEGGQIEYLDPRFVPTQVVPQSGQRVLAQGGSGSDLYVSRGHFMLSGARGGTVFMNGVPRRGGGVRPPRNWTMLLHPEHRLLTPGEELWIGPGTMIRIFLPNETILSISTK
jgi:hypothetical protein